jgi:TonB family protein
MALSVTVGTDGAAHDIKIEKKLGYGLDEEAVKAVRRWKFKPAMKDGQPVAARLTVSVSFRLY